MKLYKLKLSTESLDSFTPKIITIIIITNALASQRTVL